jgi:competence protein ComEC
LLVQYKQFEALLTGDSQSREMEEAIAVGDIGILDVLHVPHHGSRTGLTSEILERLKPKAAVISVGRNNYGHPSKEVMELLRSVRSKVIRTDRQGDIVIVTNGKTWEVR